MSWVRACGNRAASLNRMGLGRSSGELNCRALFSSGRAVKGVIGSAHAYLWESAMLRIVVLALLIVGGTSFTGSPVQAQPPAFLAYNSADDADVTGDGTVATVDFDTKIFDIGGNFAGDTFTAPVTGLYHFSGAVNIDQIGASHNAISVILVTSKRSYYGNLFNLTANAGNIVLPFSVLADMDAGDTAVIQVSVGGSTKTVDVVGDASPHSTYFRGHLVR
jgi:hypothetical protein